MLVRSKFGKRGLLQARVNLVPIPGGTGSEVRETVFCVAVVPAATGDGRLSRPAVALASNATTAINVRTMGLLVNVIRSSCQCHRDARGGRGSHQSGGWPLLAAVRRRPPRCGPDARIDKATQPVTRGPCSQ